MFSIIKDEITLKHITAIKIIIGYLNYISVENPLCPLNINVMTNANPKLQETQLVLI